MRANGYVLLFYTASHALWAAGATTPPWRFFFCAFASASAVLAVSQFWLAHRADGRRAKAKELEQDYGRLVEELRRWGK